MIPLIIKSLQGITHPRFFETERGFQGELLAELRTALHGAALADEPIAEQEYQKRLPAHGITIRPDIIIHIPTKPRGNHRTGNFVAFELKLRARQRQAKEDFANLDLILGALDYPLGVFVNINSSQTYAQHYSGVFKERIHFFALRRRSAGIELRHAYYCGTKLIEQIE